MDDYGVTTIATAYQNLKMVAPSDKQISNDAIVKAMIKFVKTYSLGDSLKYREQLLENASRGIFKLEIDYDDLDSDNTNLSSQLFQNPEETIPLVSRISILTPFSSKKRRRTCISNSPQQSRTSYTTLCLIFRSL